MSDGKTFFDLVKNDRMSDAKKLFQERMDSKIVDAVSRMRQEVAKKFFNKQK